MSGQVEVLAGQGNLMGNLPHLANNVLESMLHADGVCTTKLFYLVDRVSCQLANYSTVY